MSAFAAGLWTIASIELRQRVRGVAWYVLLGVFVLLVTGVALLGLSGTETAGIALYSIVIYFVLLLASLVTPALGGNAINGDRDAGTLATTQVTLVSTPQLVLGKFLAAWISSLAFLAAATPFILFSFVLSDVAAATVVTSIAVLAVELGVVSAVGVGLSGLLRRPLFSIVVTYLLVAMLSVGTLIAFGLGGLAIQSTGTSETRHVDWSAYNQRDVETDPLTGFPRGIEVDPSTGLPVDAECTEVMRGQFSVPRFDAVWWLLAANPYVVLADVSPTQYDRYDNPVDLFGFIKLGVRSLQQAPDLDRVHDECNPVWDQPSLSGRGIIDSSTPSWAVGLAIHLALGGALLAGAIRATRTPAQRLAPGSRIA